MKRLCFISLLIGFFISNNVFGQYLLSYEQQINGADGYSFIDPIISIDSQLAGLVYCDTVSHTLRISLMDRDTTIFWQLTDPPHKTINYSSRVGDSLVVYVLYGRLENTPNIGRLILTGDSLIFNSQWTRIYAGSGGFITKSTFGLHFQKHKDIISAVVMESLFRTEGYDFTQGPYGDNDSRSIVYSLDLATELDRQKVSAKRFGNLFGDSALESCSMTSSMHYWNYNDSYGGSNSGYVAGIIFGVQRSDRSILISQRSIDGATSSFFVDKFNPASQYDELIFYGNAVDLIGQGPAKEWHVARYDFSAGFPRKVWYHPLSGVTLDYVFNTQHVIAGLRNKNQLVALDYLGGSLSDLTFLDRSLSNVHFFETGTVPPLLSLVGRVSDTIFVYQFDTPTDVTNDVESSTLPSSFILHQNHPNPFNGSTIIHFTTQQRQRLTLRIFNLLGQPVATLIDKEMPSGEFDVTWDPTQSNLTARATGVYFARLNSAQLSRVIKLIYLK